MSIHVALNHVTHHPGEHDRDPTPARRGGSTESYEAKGRRLTRFFNMGHTPGRVEFHAEEHNPDFPFTLDLRRA